MLNRDSEGRIRSGQQLQQRYTIVRVLGSGGQGAVYEAIDTRLQGLRVAVKESFVSRQDLNRAFEREAGLLALLRDDALPRVTDYFQEDGNWFLVMDFIEGRTLWDLMEIKDKSVKGKALAIDIVREYGDKLLAALHKLHTQNTPIIHNDIKPQNITITTGGQVMLLDFGLAKGAVGKMTITSTILSGYSTWYAPVEQILRAKFGIWFDMVKRAVKEEEIDRIAAQGTDERSDLYALAATLYHLLAGEPPDVSAFRLLDISEDKPDPLKPLNEVNPQVPKAVANVLQKAMSVYREERYPSAEQMREAWGNAWEQKINLQWFEFDVVTVDANAPLTELAQLQWGRNSRETENLGNRNETEGLSPSHNTEDLGDCRETDGLNNRRGTGSLSNLTFNKPLLRPPVRGKNRQDTEDLGDGVLLHLAEIPAGRFFMGAPESEAESRDDGRPQHWVNLSAYFMGIYPVTQAQWRAVARLPKEVIDLKEDLSYFKGDNRPVEQVSWEEAVEFCVRLSRKTGKEYRLPTEAEWEYACRANTITPFHFGETITTDLANYHEYNHYHAETTEVGSFGVANEYGLYDMHGNVREWCSDWYDKYYYYLSPSMDPTGPSIGSLRVNRCGGWCFRAAFLRSAFRDGYTPGGRNSFLGFRLSRTYN